MKINYLEIQENKYYNPSITDVKYIVNLSKTFLSEKYKGSDIYICTFKNKKLVDIESTNGIYKNKLKDNQVFLPGSCYEICITEEQMEKIKNFSEEEENNF